MADTFNQKGVKTRYPVTSGLTAETTKQTGRKLNLVPQQGSNYPKRLKRGFE